MSQPVPNLVGMVHLAPLPGSPGFGGSMDEVVEIALADSSLLVEAGFPALLVENFGDVPFHADRVPPETVAAMTSAVSAVLSSGVPAGVNVLRNDALAALAVAVVCGASFIRVNVLTGLMYTDQGPIVGRAAELQRRRRALGAQVEVWADVMVKHAVPPQGVDARQAAADTVERGLADAVIVSGEGTGSEPDLHQANMIRSSVPRTTRVVIGSGATSANLDRLLEVADTVIVGSDIKVGGDARNRPDPARVAAFVDRASKRGLL